MKENPEVSAWLADKCQGNLASIDPRARQHVAVPFHRGADIPGHHPILGGQGQLAGDARFADMAAVDRRRDELAAVVRAWCDEKEQT